MQIREIMTRQVDVIPPNASVHEAAAKMKELDVGAIPVCDGQKLTGLVTDRDNHRSRSGGRPRSLKGARHRSDV
jgi:CBS domain-containing protein